MKTKTLLLAALVGVAAASAQAGVSWNISIGLPWPVFVSGPVVCSPPPVVYCPPPVVCTPPVIVQSAPPCPPPGCATVTFGGSAPGYGYVAPDGHYIRHPVQYEHQQEHNARVAYLHEQREYNREHRW